MAVDYLEPMQGNAASTDLLWLAQADGLRGFLMVMPVYRHGAPLHDAEARRRAVIGDTAAVFNASELIGKILHANGLHDGVGLAYLKRFPIDLLKVDQAAGREREPLTGT